MSLIQRKQSNSKSSESQSADLPTCKPCSDIVSRCGQDGRASHVLPDIAEDSVTNLPGKLDWVGMSGIELVMKIDHQGQEITVPVRADAFVSLDADEAKGIHMSRLYEQLKDSLTNQKATPMVIHGVIDNFVKTHHSVSHNARVKVEFDLVRKRQALVSEDSGWRHYPITIESELVEKKRTLHVTFQVHYSSTCPCSAALSRQLLERAFVKEFSSRQSVTVEDAAIWIRDNSSLATPHSQRSVATITVAIDPETNEFCFDQWVEEAEAAVRTPVQTLVKRIDEQEFARLNGENPMFCEDAARRMRNAFQQHPEVLDYRIKVEHMESLHPHDAVAIVVKGVPGGMRPS
jgi:GTP cyclohydrolase IB